MEEKETTKTEKFTICPECGYKTRKEYMRGTICIDCKMRKV